MDDTDSVEIRESDESLSNNKNDELFLDVTGFSLWMRKEEEKQVSLSLISTRKG